MGGERVYARVCEGDENTVREKRRWRGKWREWVKEKEKERIHCNCVWDF